MKDFNGEIQFRDKTYKLTFSLNVMEEIQAEYGSVDKWVELSDGKEPKLDEHGEPMRNDEDEIIFIDKEPDAKAVIFGLRAMMNEAIMNDNEDNGTDEPLLTHRQVGRIITEVGLRKATSILNNTVIDSVKTPEKNG